MDKEILKKFIEAKAEELDCFLTDLSVSADNDIVVEIDSEKGVDIDDCVALSNAVQEEFDRDVEDYSLEVGSPSLTDPLKTMRQYRKHIGDEMEVLAADGKKYRGILTEVGDNDFTLTCTEKVREEGMKRPELREVTRTFNYDNIKYTKYLIQF